MRDTQKFRHTVIHSLLMLIGIIVANVITPTLAGQQGNINAPSLKRTKSFRIYAKDGNRIVYNIEGKIIRNEEAKEFRNGELIFIVTGPDSAIFSANTGMSEISVIGDNQSLTFIQEMTEGNEHVLIIYDMWNVKEKGFKFTYVRHSEDYFKTRNSLLQREVHRVVYSGVAKPAGQYKSPHISRESGPFLQEIKVFGVHERKAHFQAFNSETGELLEETQNSSGEAFRNGSHLFTITGPSSAIFAGRHGAGRVDLVKDECSATFIETTPAGTTKHIMIVTDQWDTNEKGFVYTYIRHIDHWLSMEFLRTVSSGIAKPVGW